MSDALMLLVSFSICAISMLGGVFPLFGRFLVLSRCAAPVLILASVLFACALIAVLSNEMSTRLAFLVAGGVAPLHQLLLLRFLYQRFIEANGRPPLFASRRAPQADRAFAASNLMFGVIPYAVLAMIFAKPGH